MDALLPSEEFENRPKLCKGRTDRVLKETFKGGFLRLKEYA